MKNKGKNTKSRRKRWGGNAIFFGLGRLAKNNWLSRIVKARLLLFVVVFFFLQLNRGRMKGQSEGQGEERKDAEWPLLSFSGKLCKWVCSVKCVDGVCRSCRTSGVQGKDNIRCSSASRHCFPTSWTKVPLNEQALTQWAWPSQTPMGTDTWFLSTGASTRVKPPRAGADIMIFFFFVVVAEQQGFFFSFPFLYFAIICGEQ